MKKYNLVVCGGTFDHFHKGHEAFLEYAFSVGKKNIIGVTSDNYVRNLKSRIQNSEFEDFEKRKQSILKFIKKEGVLGKTETVEINDLFGPTLDKSLAIDAILVSEDTKEGADIINERRRKLGLKELDILIATSVKAEDGEIISSSRIRKGEINREGNFYIKKEWFEKDLKLPENVREELKKPLGDLLIDTRDLSSDENHLVITVGDITTKAFNDKSLGQNLSVIDFKVAREEKFANILELGFVGDKTIFNADNPAGFITAVLFRKLAEIFKENIKETILQINGEEDLTVLPLILFSPLNTIVYYGQPGLGLVKVVVSEGTKEKAYNLVLRLKSA